MSPRHSLLGGLAALVVSCAPASVPAPGPEAVVVRVVSYNIRHGRGMDGQVDLDRTAAVLRRLAPDLVGLQEVDSVVERSGRIAQAEALGARLGMHAVFGGFMDYQGGRYGMGILSRFAIRHAESIRLPDGNEPRVALLVRVDLPGVGEVAVVNVHFDWVADDGFRFAQATALAAVLDTLSVPYLLLGDFNALPDSRTLALYRQRAREAVKPSRATFTFPSPVPEREIDYIFGSPAARWTADSVAVIADLDASDHRPVFARMRWR